MADAEVRRDIPQAERDAMDAADFAGKDKSFPINRPEDVDAAAKSMGRAGEDNYSADELKARIIAIAKRKGAAFVAQLPQAWRDEMEHGGDGEGSRAFGVPWGEQRAFSFAPGSAASRTLHSITQGRRGG